MVHPNNFAVMKQPMILLIYDSRFCYRAEGKLKAGNPIVEGLRLFWFGWVICQVRRWMSMPSTDENFFASSEPHDLVQGV